MEGYRPIPGYEGYYSVSESGLVKSLARTKPRPKGVGVIQIPESIKTAHLDARGWAHVPAAKP